MSTISRTNVNFYSTESFSIDFTEINDWLASLKSCKIASTSNDNFKLNHELHLAITTAFPEYASSLCDHLFTLYRHVQHRPFVLQFLPSFLIAYYDILYQTSSNEKDNKDLSTTIDTFLIGLYNISVSENNSGEKVHEFRVPDLTLPSIYHKPNADHYAPAPLTQHAISKHEKRPERCCLQPFTPFDSVNSTTREQILWFLLIQYGINVALINNQSYQFYIQMANKLLGQGFSFNEHSTNKSTDSRLPPTGRRIRVSSRMMTEVLGTLLFFKANSKMREVARCLRLLKQRAEYELYADVILMTESMSYLHEFESQRPEKQDSIGIEVELPPTLDMVKQKRTAITTRSMKHRHRSHKHRQQYQQSVAANQPINETVTVPNDLPNDTIEHLNFVPAPSDATPETLIPPTSYRHRSILESLDENSVISESLPSSTLITPSPSILQQNDAEISQDQTAISSEHLPEAKSNISSSIGPAISSPSPSSIRQYKPASLTSTQTYFNTIQQQQRASSPNSQHVQTILYQDCSPSLSRSPSLKHREKRETISSVRFVGTNENNTKEKETYL